MSFKKVQAKIAKKSGVSKKAAGAILASASRNASASAKKKNPKLKKVTGTAKTKKTGSRSALSQSVTRRKPKKAAKVNAVATAGRGKQDKPGKAKRGKQDKRATAGRGKQDNRGQVKKRI